MTRPISSIVTAFLLTLLSAPTVHSQQPATKSAAPATDTVTFSDVTGLLGISFKHEASPTSQKYLVETMGAGVALFDCDNDGRLDVFLVNGAPIQDPMPKGALPKKDGPRYWNRLYHQKPDGTFEDITEASGLAGTGYGMGVATGDYDNDGNEDLYVTAYPNNVLYHNDGHCHFTDVTSAAGVGGSGWSTSAVFVDLDNDGLLDLVVARYLDWSFDKNIYCGEKRDGYRAYCHPDMFGSVSTLVFHNDGNGRFHEVQQANGMGQANSKGLGLAVADFDRDGKIDVALANDSVPESLYRNLSNGKFQDVALAAGTAVDEDGNTFAGMGIDFGDYDNDGFPDLLITNLSEQRYALYHNQGDGTFIYVTNSSGLGAITQMNAGWGLKFLDYDNDGRKDVLIAQGHVLDTIQLTHPHLRYLQAPLLLHNAGNKFVDVSPGSGAVFQEKWAARGLAIGDIDNDGDLDAVITTNNGPVYVLRNDGGNRKNWLTLRLVGKKSNRDGIGAEVKLVLPSGLSQYATVTTGGSYLSASDRRVHFGMGEEKTGRVEIRWPSGIVQKLENIKANQQMTVEESVASAKP